MNHKYFPNKEYYNSWLKSNTNVEIMEITKVQDSGIYIEYIQYKDIPQRPQKPKRLGRKL
jgi:hypothetical protein